MLAQALSESMADLRKRIANVRLGPIVAGRETFDFTLDGSAFTATQRGRLLNAVIGLSESADKQYAVVAILDGLAVPQSTAMQSQQLEGATQ